MKLIGPSFDSSHNKWQNGYVGADGNVYAIPLNAMGALQIVTATDDVNVIGCFDGGDKWEGGVEADDGALYFMPLRAKYVAKVVPPGSLKETSKQQQPPPSHTADVQEKARPRVNASHA